MILAIQSPDGVGQKGIIAGKANFWVDFGGERMAANASGISLLSLVLSLKVSELLIPTSNWCGPRPDRVSFPVAMRSFCQDLS
jgi:hypothetical protein